MSLALLLAAAVTVSNKVVFVDQAGKINAPEVVASVADMTSNRTEIAIANAAAQTAGKAAREAQKMIDTTVSSIVANELVIYRQGFTDSLGVMVVLPPDTKCRITAFTPNVASDGKGNVQHEIVYATTADASAVPPGIKHASTLNFKDVEFRILDASIKKTNLETTYEDVDGTVYNYMYSIKFWMPSASQGFYIVYLDADAASGDGMTFDITGGITGGYTGDVLCGGDTLTFKGGLLMGVKSNE
jgi:hypothetical protein